ncbi:uncharacterized protein LOC133053809, partial [Dama dama]|uniref:uncharacterized protein LOC133053809 n=1 Tax=Dama dama TaxID=30532 RepID=UPI002A35E800
RVSVGEPLGMGTRGFSPSWLRQTVLLRPSRVIPPPLPFRLRYTKAVFCRASQRPEPQPTAEPEQPAAPRARVARTLTRQPAHTACSPTTSLTPQPPQGHRLPSASPARPQARAPSTRHRPPAAPGHPSHALPCPGVHQCGPASSSADPPLPPAHPDRTPVPASHGCLARRRHRLHASAEALLEWPAHLSARSPRVPCLPFPPALHADATPKHPWACLPEPGSLPPPLPAMALPRSLILVGAPTSHGPRQLRPALSPTHADAHGPGRGVEETSCGDG